MKKRRFDNENKNIMCHDGNYEESYIFPNIQELLQYIESFDTTDCLFRGQSGLWEVTSSLHRHCSSMEGLQKASAITNKAVKWLKSNKYINSMLKDNDDYALAVAQHYGCPTDLIDLTKNCRTAAYFASSDNNRHIETPVGCIWVFTKKDLKKFGSMRKLV